MKTFYLIRYFDKKIQTVSIPDPGLFETAEEAIAYCERFSNNNMMLGYTPVRVGKIDLNK